MSTEILTDREPTSSLMNFDVTRPLRSAWLEVDLAQLRQNFAIINRDKSPAVQFVSVVKDEAYGHGLLPVARVAIEAGAAFLAVSTLDEALALRAGGIQSRILIFGERQENELACCLHYDLTPCIGSRSTAEKMAALAARSGRRVPVHLKVNTGMNRYGVRWDSALPLARFIAETKSLVLEGVFSHFSMSDELDKTFAFLQLERFQNFLAQLSAHNLPVKFRHICNSGGFLDLPQAHLDLLRIGILQHGIYPSKVCRRIPGIKPTLTVKARVATLQHIQKDDVVGYGMRYQAPSPRTIAVIPVGYGDGFPRLRNQGCVLVGGQRAPLVGGVAMDAFMVDVTDVPDVKPGDEAVLMGRQGGAEISVYDVAQWKNGVSYEVLTGWRARLPRVYLNETPAA